MILHKCTKCKEIFNYDPKKYKWAVDKDKLILVKINNTNNR